MAFNLKKQAEKAKAVKGYEKMNIDENDKFDLKPPGAKITEKQLDDDHKEPDGAKITEKQLDEGRIVPVATITEDQLNKKGEKYRHQDGVPLMDMAKENSNKLAKEFKKVKDGIDTETMFWDGYVGTQIPEDQITKIVANDQRSQLLSNYPDRASFLKANPSFQKPKKVEASVESLKDADAMLYHLYRQAAEENRGLTENEQKIAAKVNDEKKTILAQMTGPNGPFGPDNPGSDDLGLSPDMGYDDFSGEGDDPEKTDYAVMSKGGPGLYFSVTGDIPEGPFDSVQEAMAALNTKLRRWVAEDLRMKPGRTVEQWRREWLSNTEFFSFDGKEIDDIGNALEQDINSPAGEKQVPGYWDTHSYMSRIEGKSSKTTKTAQVDEDDMDEEGYPECQECHGQLIPMGTLGNRVHYRCRNCGMQFSKEVKKLREQNFGVEGKSEQVTKEAQQKDWLSPYMRHVVEGQGKIDNAVAIIQANPVGSPERNKALIELNELFELMTGQKAQNAKTLWNWAIGQPGRDPRLPHQPGRRAHRHGAHLLHDRRPSHRGPHAAEHPRCHRRTDRTGRGLLHNPRRHPPPRPAAGGFINGDPGYRS